MAGQLFPKGGLGQAFKNAIQLDDQGRRQLKAGLAATGVGYAALGVLCAVDVNASYMLIKQFSWQQVPLHALFALSTNLIGAGGMAAYDKLTGRAAEPEQNGDAPAQRTDAPQPKP